KRRSGGGPAALLGLSRRRPDPSRVLTIVDTFSRFSPAVDPRFSYRGEDVVLTLERICKTVGYPKRILADQGAESVSRDLDIWAYQKGVALAFSRPGKPTDKSFIE